MTIRALVCAALACLAACSSLQTTPSTGFHEIIGQGERFQLLVRSGNSAMDKLLYELAYEQFSTVVPLREKEPYTGTMEITFASSTQSAFLGSSSTVSNATAGASGWYTNTGYLGQASAVGSSTTITSGGTFDWQNSIMIVVIKHSDGERLWSGDYNYKGGWEFSGFVVNTPEEAARLVAKRLKTKLEADLKKK